MNNETDYFVIQVYRDGCWENTNFAVDIKNRDDAIFRTCKVLRDASPKLGIEQVRLLETVTQMKREHT